MTDPGPLLRYLSALAAAALATFLTWGLSEVTGLPPVYLFFLGAVFAASWYGGFGAGVLATVVSALSATFFFIPPRFAFWPLPPGHSLILAFFLAGGIAMAAVIERWERYRRRLQGQRERNAERERAVEEELRASHGQLEAILQGVSDSITVQDAEGRLVYANDAAARNLGFASARKLLRNPPDKLFRRFDILDEHGAPLDLALLPGRRILRGEPAPDLLLRYRIRETGEERWGVSKASAVRGEGGELRLAINILQDITERQRMYETLLAEDRRKEQFLAMLAHELRNPLAPILNAIEVIRLRRGDEAAQARALDLAARQAGHMARLLDDLLDVSRITRGKIELRRRRVDLRELIRQTVETRRPLFEARDLQLAVSLPDEPVWVEADATRLEQVFTNLLHNAAKYTDLGGRIWLAAETRGGEVEVRVRDTGAGIPAEMLPRIFDLFSQADSSLDRSQGGLGIGLTLVRNLVELHGGSVSASSEGPGLGSELTVRLPLAAREAAPERRAADERPAGAAPPAERRRRVLIVEDNLDSASLLTELLGFWGHEARTVHDGLSALEAAAGFRPEVVLLDIGLPGMDGYEVARRLRGMEEAASGRALLVALTGYGQEADKKRAREAGFDRHFTKPVDLDTLRAVLNAA